MSQIIPTPAPVGHYAVANRPTGNTPPIRTITVYCAEAAEQRAYEAEQYDRAWPVAPAAPPSRIRIITVYCAACHLEGTGTDFRAGTGYEGARHLEEQGWRRAGHGRWKCPRCANQRSKQRHHGRGWPGR